MIKYHVSPSGQWGICEAKEGNCPYGNENHFNTPEEALMAAERIWEKQFFKEMEEGFVPPSNAKFKLTNDGIQIVDPGIQYYIDQLNLSPTFVKDFNEDPANTILSLYLKDRFGIEQDDTFLEGVLFHKAISEFMKMDAKKRTDEAFVNCINKTIDSYPKFQDYRDDPIRLELVDKMVKIEKNAQEIPIFNSREIDAYKHLRPGFKNRARSVELYLKDGKIGDTVTPVTGGADMLVEFSGKDSPLGEGLYLLDWKTGSENRFKSVERETPHVATAFEQKSTELQLSTYAELLRGQGVQVDGAVIVYPNHKTPTFVWIDVESDDVRKRTRDAYEKADKLFVDCVKNNYTFPTKKGFDSTWGGIIENAKQLAKDTGETQQHYGFIDLSDYDFSKDIEE